MTRIDPRSARPTSVDAKEREAPRGGAPSADVANRATRIQQLLGGLSVPFRASEIPDGLIRAPERRTVEVRRRARPVEPSRPELDARSFDVLNRLVVAKTTHLKAELGRHFEFVGAFGDAVRTPSGRWYFRVTDPRGQQLDVLFGAGLNSGAKIMMHAHAGRNAYSDDLSPEATLELARLVSTIRLRPAPPRAESEFIVDGEEELPEDREEVAKEGYRKDDLAEAKAALRAQADATPKRLPPLLREIARKDASDLAEADLDRLVGAIADAPIMLRAFELDSYDGSTLRLVRNDADGKVSLVEIMIQEYEDREPGALLRVAIPPDDPPAREYAPDLESDLRILDDVDDDLLTPSFEVTSTSLGLALFRFAVERLAYPPLEVNERDELLRYVDPNRKNVDDPEPVEEAATPDQPEQKPLTAAEKRKFRLILKWADANWDAMLAANVINQNGFHPSYWQHYATQTPPEFRTKLAQLADLVMNDVRYTQRLGQSNYTTREVIQKAIAELEEKKDAE